MFILRLIWGVMMATVLCYGLVGYFTWRPADVAATVPAEPLLWGFGFFSAVLVLGAFLAHRKLCDPSRVAELVVRDWEAKRAAGMDPRLDVSEQKDAESMASTPVENAILRLSMMAWVLPWALAEAAAINGFTLSQVMHRPDVYLPFGVVALVVMTILRPRSDWFETVGKKVEISLPASA